MARTPSSWKPTDDELADWTSGTLERKARAYESYRGRVGSGGEGAMLALDLYAMGETFDSLEPMALLKRIRALEAR